MASTVREWVADIQRECRDTPVAPERACELLSTLTALLGNCNDEIRIADQEYANVLIGLLNSEEKANRARIRAEVTPEYDRKRTARDTKELVVELVRSLKYLLRSTQEEMRLSR